MIGTNQIIAKLNEMNEYSLTHKPEEWLKAEDIIDPDFSQFMINFPTIGSIASPDAVAAFMIGWELAKDKYKPKIVRGDDELDLQAGD